MLAQFRVQLGFELVPRVDQVQHQQTGVLCCSTTIWAPNSGYKGGLQCSDATASIPEHWSICATLFGKTRAGMPSCPSWLRCCWCSERARFPSSSGVGYGDPSDKKVISFLSVEIIRWTVQAWERLWEQFWIWPFRSINKLYYWKKFGNKWFATDKISWFLNHIYAINYAWELSSFMKTRSSPMRKKNISSKFPQYLINTPEEMLDSFQEFFWKCLWLFGPRPSCHPFFFLK